MRATIIIVFLSSLFCFGSGQSLHKSMDSYRTYKALTLDLNGRHTECVDSSNWHSTISVDNELVLLEESCSTDDSPNTFFALKSIVAKKSYPSLKATVIVKDNCKGVKNFHSFYGYSQPIYIYLGVLRI